MKCKTVVCQMSLGRTRVNGYILYDHETMAFEETTPMETQRLVKKGYVNGLKLENGKLVLDIEGYNMKDLTIKSGVGRYRLFSDPDKIALHNLYYLTKLYDTYEGVAYEAVTNLCARLVLTENAIRKLYDKGVLSGCWIDDITGNIQLSDGVEIVDMTLADGGQAGGRRLKEIEKVRWNRMESSTKEIINSLAESGNEEFISIRNDMENGKEFAVILMPQEEWMNLLKESSEPEVEADRQAETADRQAETADRQAETADRQAETADRQAETADRQAETAESAAEDEKSVEDEPEQSEDGNKAKSQTATKKKASRAKSK